MGPEGSRAGAGLDLLYSKYYLYITPILWQLPCHRRRSSKWHFSPHLLSVGIQGSPGQHVKDAEMLPKMCEEVATAMGAWALSQRPRPRASVPAGNY